MRISGTTFSDVDPLDKKRKVLGKCLYDLIDETATLAKADVDLYGSEDNLFACAVEELGEYAAARIVEKGRKKKKLKESSKVEAIDLTICALSLFFASGGTIDELTAIGTEKIKKWHDRIYAKK